MSTHDLLGHRAYWGLVGDGVEAQLDFDHLATGRLCGVQPGRLDVCLHEEVSSRVTVTLGLPPAEATFRATTFFPAGMVKLDDSDAGYALTDVTLPHEGEYDIALTEGDRVDGRRTFTVILTIA